MFKTLIAALAFCLLVVSAPFAMAQKTAVCNPGKVFEGLTERSAIEEDMKALNTRLTNEANNKKRAITDLKTTIEGLMPGSTVRADKEQEYTRLVIELDVWAKVQQANMANIEKTRIKQIFDKITEAVKKIAIEKKIDLVITDSTPKLPEDMSNITGAQLGSILTQIPVLYINKDAKDLDITSDVVSKMNAEYKRP